MRYATGAVTAAAALALALAGGTASADPAPIHPAPAHPAPAHPAPLDPATAVYELRTYYPAPGKAAALNARFRMHTMALFARHGMTNVAYWNEIATPAAPEGRLVYVLAYPSRAARDADWAAFGQDPAWRKVVAESEAAGKLVTRVDSVFMTAADYSPPILGK